MKRVNLLNKIKPPLLLITMLLLSLSSCKGRGDILGTVDRKEPQYDKYEDSYENYLYRNEFFKLEIGFDSLWRVKSLYRHFDTAEKRLAQFVASDEAELLFIGTNDDKQLGVRATTEKIALSPEEYFKEFKKQYAIIATEYNMQYKKEETITLTNVEGYNVIYEVKINAANSFTYNCFIFKTKDYIIRIDFWTRAELYEEREEYIKNILKYIDIK